jgi:hypothetical protein
MLHTTKKQQKYFFESDITSEEVLDLDQKLLKYLILYIKNNPKYFQEDGYQFYLYDRIGELLKNLEVVKGMATPKQGDIGESEMYVSIDNAQNLRITCNGDGKFLLMHQNGYKTDIYSFKIAMGNRVLFLKSDKLGAILLVNFINEYQLWSKNELPVETMTIKAECTLWWFEKTKTFVEFLLQMP